MGWDGDPDSGENRPGGLDAADTDYEFVDPNPAGTLGLQQLQQEEGGSAAGFGPFNITRIKERARIKYSAARKQIQAFCSLNMRSDPRLRYLSAAGQYEDPQKSF